MEIFKADKGLMSIKFRELNPGDVFLYSGKLFMKTRERVDPDLNAVNLTENWITHFSSSTVVSQVDAKLTYSHLY